MAAHISDERRAEIISLAHLPIFEIIRATGATRNTVSGTLAKAGLGPAARPTVTHDQFTTYESIHGLPKPRVRVKAGSSVLPGPAVGVGPIVRVVVIADTHDNPGLQQHRFDHLGKFVADHAPDYLVHIGDWADFEFASRFEDWSSLNGRERNPFRDEMDSLSSAVERLQTPLAHMSKPPKLITTLGNHDERVWLFENTHPECEGMMWSELQKALGEWDITPYRQIKFIEGVGFTHCPINKMGKPYGGKTVANQVANDTTFSVVFGHTHEYQYLNRGKLGPNNAVTVFNAPCAMPQQYLKSYAMLSTTGWSYGVSTLDIQDGRILGHSVVSMDLLERRYG